MVICNIVVSTKGLLVSLEAYCGMQLNLMLIMSRDTIHPYHLYTIVSILNRSLVAFTKQNTN